MTAGLCGNAPTKHARCLTVRLCRSRHEVQRALPQRPEGGVTQLALASQLGLQPGARKASTDMELTVKSCMSHVSALWVGWPSLPSRLSSDSSLRGTHIGSNKGCLSQWDREIVVGIQNNGALTS